MAQVNESTKTETAGSMTPGTELSEAEQFLKALHERDEALASAIRTACDSLSKISDLLGKLADVYEDVKKG